MEQKESLSFYASSFFNPSKMEDFSLRNEQMHLRSYDCITTKIS